MKVLKKPTEIMKRASVESEEWVVEDFKSVSIAKVKIKGRVPETGWKRHSKCDEVIYILSGEGRIVSETDESELKPGYVAFIPKKTWFYIEGDMVTIIPTHPIWKFENEEHKK